MGLVFYKGSQIPDDVWPQLSRVFLELGVDGANYTQNLNKSKGAIETLVFIERQLKNGASLKAVEQRELALKVGDVEKYRLYDAIMELDGKEIKFEIKAWKPENIQKFLYQSFKGSSKAPDGTIQQLQVDLVNALKSSLSGGKVTNVDNVNIRWVFDGRVGEKAGEGAVELAKDDIIEDFVDNLADDEATLKNLLSSMGDDGAPLQRRLFEERDIQKRQENRRAFYADELPKLLDKMIISNG